MEKRRDVFTEGKRVEGNFKDVVKRLDGLWGEF